MGWGLSPPLLVLSKEEESMMRLEDVKAELKSRDSLAGYLWTEAREGMAFVSNEGKMELVNPSFARLLGYSVHELEGQTFSSITIGADVAHDIAEFEKLLSGEIREYTMVKTYNTKARTTITVRLRAVNFDTGLLVLGAILPVDTLSLEQLPPEDARKIISMLVGRWAVENWKKLACFLAAVMGIVRLDYILALFS